MKKVLIILLVLNFSATVKAQICTPYWNDTTWGINPDTIDNLPPAYVNIPYDAVIQFKVPSTAVFNNLPISIHHILLESIDGLSAIPTTVPFFYNCNPTTCSFEKDSIGCVRLQGTPSAVGTFELLINTKVYPSSNFGFLVPATGYRITVSEVIGIPQLNQQRFDVSQNFPNPVNSISDVTVNITVPENIKLTISNLVGNQLFSGEYNGKKGINHLTIDAAGYPEGIYFYTVSCGELSITKRMVVNRR